MENNWHKKDLANLINELETSEHGLNSDQVKINQEKYGSNKLPEAKTQGLGIIFIKQFQSPLIYLLLGASFLVFLINEAVDGAIILAVLIFNAVVGTIQEGKAQNTLKALKDFVETKATVVRDGQEVIIPDSEVVPGDLLVLQEGERVAADARIIQVHNLTAEEAALTGESVPVHKKVEAENTSSEDDWHKNLVYKGTTIVAGNGLAIVYATGKETEIGKIANKIIKLDTEIPLKNNIRHLSRAIISIVVLVSGYLLWIGSRTGLGMRELFATIVSLAVSIVPEGLPIVVTLILAMGVWRMSRRNALVKKLQAVEALGQATLLAIDKTGTITKNELIIKKIFTGEKYYEVTGVGYEPKGEILLEGHTVDAPGQVDLLLAGKICAMCSNARIMEIKGEKRWRIAGDPTEAAMLVLAQKLGFHKEDTERENPVIAEIPFDYTLKIHATLRQSGKKYVLALAGAPEVVLELSSHIWVNGKRKALTEQSRKDLDQIFIRMSQEGLRVVASAIVNNATKQLNVESLKNLTFLAFYGFKDSIRPEAIGAIAKARSAGVKPLMITGDHKITAQSIASEVGVWKKGSKALTGKEIDEMSDVELEDSIKETTVFARVNPQHKLRIIESFRKSGEIIAMTGDGVNDAPSLVAADLGVSMGKIGTEVAKEASDIVLLDDNLDSIVYAIEEGRNIYKTIRKVLLYLFSTSVGEVIAIAGSITLGLSLPILPVQIIWLNLVTDGFLDVSLAMEPKESGLLEARFERPKKYLIDKLMAIRMAIMSTTMGLGTLLLYHNYHANGSPKAWTVSLTTLAVMQWLNAWNCRSEKRSVLNSNPFTNPYLVASTLVVTALQLSAVYSPILQKFLRTVPLNATDWSMILGVSASILVVEELRKLILRVWDTFKDREE